MISVRTPCCPHPVLRTTFPRVEGYMYAACTAVSVSAVWQRRKATEPKVSNKQMVGVGAACTAVGVSAVWQRRKATEPKVSNKQMVGVALFVSQRLDRIQFCRLIRGIISKEDADRHTEANSERNMRQTRERNKAQ